MGTYYVYTLCSASGTLYTGVTNNLTRRIGEHKQKSIPGFTRRYEVIRLVHFEILGSPAAAIAREKQLKSWRRSKKLALISAMNPSWDDLSKSWFSEAISASNVVAVHGAPKQLALTCDSKQRVIPGSTNQVIIARAPKNAGITRRPKSAVIPNGVRDPE